MPEAAAPRTPTQQRSACLSWCTAGRATPGGCERRTGSARAPKDNAIGKHRRMWRACGSRLWSAMAVTVSGPRCLAAIPLASSAPAARARAPQHLSTRFPPPRPLQPPPPPPPRGSAPQPPPSRSGTLRQPFSARLAARGGPYPTRLDHAPKLDPPGRPPRLPRPTMSTVVIVRQRGRRVRAGSGCL